MTGEVDAAGRALVTFRVRAGRSRPHADVVAWIDTAFDGELVMPRNMIDRLGLVQSAAVSATLADGTTAVLETFQCVVEWFEGERAVEVIANNGRHPLLGIGMLKQRRLHIDYPARTLSLE